MKFMVNVELALEEVVNILEQMTVIGSKDFGVFSVQQVKHTCPTTSKETMFALVNGMNGKSTLLLAG